MTSNSEIPSGMVKSVQELLTKKGPEIIKEIDSNGECRIQTPRRSHHQKKLKKRNHSKKSESKRITTRQVRPFQFFKFSTILASGLILIMIWKFRCATRKPALFNDIVISFLNLKKSSWKESRIEKNSCWYNLLQDLNQRWDDDLRRNWLWLFDLFPKWNQYGQTWSHHPIRTRGSHW